jgi:hypothetical protein
MMRLKPLEQWICDTCGEVIQSVDDGWVEWTRDDKGRRFGFRICHHATASPIRAEREEPRSPSCYHYEHGPRADLPLKDMAGTTGMARMLSFIDVGKIHDPDAEQPPRVANLRDWTETFRRLFVPYYEEARLHFDAAEADGFFADANEVWPYTESILKQITEEHGDD